MKSSTSFVKASESRAVAIQQVECPSNLKGFANNRLQKARQENFAAITSSRQGGLVQLVKNDNISNGLRKVKDNQNRNGAKNNYIGKNEDEQSKIKILYEKLLAKGRDRRIKLQELGEIESDIPDTSLAITTISANGGKITTEVDVVLDLIDSTSKVYRVNSVVKNTSTNKIIAVFENSFSFKNDSICILASNNYKSNDSEDFEAKIGLLCCKAEVDFKVQMNEILELQYSCVKRAQKTEKNLNTTSSSINDSISLPFTICRTPSLSTDLYKLLDEYRNNRIKCGEQDIKDICLGSEHGSSFYHICLNKGLGIDVVISVTEAGVEFTALRKTAD